MKMAELKPCPWCGSIDFDDRYVYVKCNQCLATGPQMNCGRHDDHSDYIDHKNALKAWNTRNDEAARQEERERCAKVCDDELDLCPMDQWDEGWNCGVKNCIEAIRKMGEKDNE